jgi:hypothetical protein
MRKITARTALNAAALTLGAATVAGVLTLTSITTANARNPDTSRPQPAGTVTVHAPTPAAPTPAKVITAYQVAHALKTCDVMSQEFQVPCIALYLRDAETRTLADGSVITNPPGPALVAECLDTDSEPSELMGCLTQPAL